MTEDRERAAVNRVGHGIEESRARADDRRSLGESRMMVVAVLPKRAERTRRLGKVVQSGGRVAELGRVSRR